MIKYYMELRYEGESGPYFYEKEVEAYGLHKSKIPEGYSGARFFNRDVMVINGVEVKGEKKDETGWYYVGEKLSLDEAKSQGKISEEKYKKYSSCGHRMVVITKQGRAIPLWVADTVVTA